MKYKAFIFDLDGTAIPNRRDGMPSEKVIDAVKQAKDFVQVGIATGRSVLNCRHLLKVLDITAPSVVAGGTQIIDPVTEETLWKKGLSPQQVHQILEIALPYNLRVILGDDKGYTQVKENDLPGEWQIVYIMDADPEDANEIINKFRQVSQIACHEVNSWSKGQIDLHITHSEATKRHSLEKVLKLMKVDKQNVIGAGDSNNDKPIFEVSGLKVAMGNASDDLKSLADYIAPPVEEDGLVEVIEKFILK